VSLHHRPPPKIPPLGHSWARRLPFLCFVRAGDSFVSASSNLRDLRRKLSEHKRERSRSCLVREESCTDFSVRMKLAAPGARVGRRAACRMNVLHVINPMGQGVIEE